MNDVNMNDLDPLPRDLEGARVAMALREMVAVFAERQAWITEHQAVHGTPDSDSPTDALLVTVNAELLALIECVGVIGQVLANDLTLRGSATPGADEPS